MEVIGGSESRVQLREEGGVHVHAWFGRPTEATVDAYYARLTAIGGRAEPFLLVTETASAGVPSAGVRTRIGEPRRSGTAP